MCLAADPIHGPALYGELHRPDKCRFCGPHYEQGLEIFAHGVRVWRRHLLHRLLTIPSARQSDSRSDRGTELVFLHHGGMGFAVRLERTGTNPNQFLRGAISPGRGGSGVCSRHVSLSDLLVSEGPPCPLDRVFHDRRSPVVRYWLPALLLAFAVLKYLPDGPARALWLTNGEKQTIAARLEAEEPAGRPDLWPALRDLRV